MSCKQVCRVFRDDRQPSFGNGAFNSGSIFRRRPAKLVQEWPVDLFDADAAIMHRFDRMGDLYQLAGRDVRIGIVSGLDSEGVTDCWIFLMNQS